MSRVMSRLRSIGVVLGTTVNVFCIGHCAVEYGGEITILTGPSMRPTFNRYADNNVVITERLSLSWRSLQVGDVVIARSPHEPKQLVCKRISALAGDKLERSDGMYGESPDKYVIIPRGHVWLLGDNPDNSTDSRDYGPVPLGLIRGKVCLKIWPPSEFGLVK